MRFKVPQNVQREDTIIGPLTLKQMAILGGGGGIAYGIFISLSKSYFIEIWLPPVLIVSLLTLAFAFLKIHSLAFHVFLMNFIEYHFLAKKRIWIQGSADAYPNLLEEKPKATTQTTEVKAQPNIQKISEILDSGGKKRELEKLIKQNY